MRGCSGKITRRSARPQAVEHRAEALGRVGVVVAVDGGEHVLALLAALASAVAGREQDVGEDVAGHLDRALDRPRSRRLARVPAGREEQIGEPVGLDPVGLLGHVVAVAAQAGLDVEQRHPGRDGGARAGERRVGVAADQHRVGLLRLDHPGDPLLGDGDALVRGSEPTPRLCSGSGRRRSAICRSDIAGS